MLMPISVDAEEYRINLERNILIIIEERLKNGKMDTARAKAIARMVLDKLHPPLTLEEIYEIAPSLDDHFTELASAILPIVEEHDEKVKKIVTEHVQQLINSGKIEEATSLLRKATSQK